MRKRDLTNVIKDQFFAKLHVGKTVLFTEKSPIHEKVGKYYTVTGYEDKPVKYQAVKTCRKNSYVWVKSKRPVDILNQ
jgi:hypothetical protein